MSSLCIEGDIFAPDDVDLKLILEEQPGTYFWAEHGDAVIEVHGVDEGGNWCRFKDPRRLLDAIGPEGQGVAHSWDGGGEPYLIRRVCALPNALVLQILHTFLRDGSMSDAVQWGKGVVRDSFGLLWRDPETYEADDAAEMLEELDDGLTLTLEGPLKDRHARCAVWDAISRIYLSDEDGLSFLAQHPAAELRELDIAQSLSLAALQKTLDQHPSLEMLTLCASGAAELHSLRAPGLRRLIIEMDSHLNTAESVELARLLRLRTRQWELAPDAELLLPDDPETDDDPADSEG